jgi:L-ascorbate metabolism protein UlaG (beta-lactamase superfamily)
LKKKIFLIGPVKFKRHFPIDLDTLPDIDVVIVSHDHYDHLNKASVQALEKITQLFVVPAGVGGRLRSWGIRKKKIVELKWWEYVDVDAKLKITATPAQHFSGRSLTDRNRTLWASWAIESTSHTVFFSGDSGYFGGFKQIGEQLGPFDMAFLECGAYHHLWHAVHMYPEETVQAHLDLQAAVLHPIHWGTFNLSFHPWYEPMQRLAAAAWKQQVVYATPVVGETIVPEQNRLGSHWWETVLPVNKNQMIQTG